MLSVEFSCCLLVKLEHFEVGDIELFFSGCYHFAKVHIGIGFKHSIGSSSNI